MNSEINSYLLSVEESGDNDGAFDNYFIRRKHVLRQSLINKK